MYFVTDGFWNTRQYGKNIPLVGPSDQRAQQIIESLLDRLLLIILFNIPPNP